MIAIFRHQFSLMIVYAVSLHYLWAVCLIVDPSAVWATALSVFPKIVGLPIWIMPAIFTIVASLALVAVFQPSISGSTIALMLPQQFTLMISAWGAISATMAGHFGDGVERSHSFILADQAPSIIAAVAHTAAIIGMGQRWSR